MHDLPDADWIDCTIDRFERPLLAYANRMLGGDWQAAQDAVQETFLRLCRGERRKIESRIAPWLFTVCRTRVIDLQRTQRANPMDMTRLEVKDPGPEVSESLSHAEDRGQLAKGVESLTPRQREVVQLRIQSGLSYREIAEVTGMTVSNVGVHLHQAVKRLRETMVPG